MVLDSNTDPQPQEPEVENGGIYFGKDVSKRDYSNNLPQGELGCILHSHIEGIPSKGDNMCHVFATFRTYSRMKDANGAVKHTIGRG